MFTAIIFVPAALLTKVFGEPFGNSTVRLQNSFILASLAAFLLPKFIRRWVPTSPTVLRGGAFNTWMVTNWFAPYPLVLTPTENRARNARQKWPYFRLALTARRYLCRYWHDRRFHVAAFVHSRSLLLLAGIVAGIAGNHRPAYLIPVILVVLITLLSHKSSGLLMLAGINLALVP